ncbi:MAG: FAD-dependent oxidoreductase [Bacteroidota bacterium]|nr:FAD-dependent oxidoreductase [Bacteroidota bacterium]
MAKPIIYIVDENAQTLQEIVALMSPFNEKFNIITSQNPKSLIDALKKEDSQRVALILVDDDLKIMSGLEFIEGIKDICTVAKKVLITQNSKREETVKAFKENLLDCYILKPYNPATEKFIPVIEDMLIHWKDYEEDSEGIIEVIGPRWAPELHNIMNFLSRNLFPFKFYDIEKDPTGWKKLKENNIFSPSQALVIFPDGSSEINPEIQLIAKKAGLSLDPESKFYDLIIIGAGPAGLAASVYAASEGLSTLIIEKEAPGGQAGTSAHIANYLGFPAGISGEELSKRAIAQAEKFGVEIISASEVKDIKIKGGYKTVLVNNNIKVSCYAILLSNGVSYKKLNIPGLQKFAGAGIYYGAVNTEAPLCEGQDVFLIGGGNSAGQAAMYLSQFAKTVRILIIEESLKNTMSQYLIEQIEGVQNIEVHATTEIKEAIGEKNLKKVKVENNSTGEINEYDATAVFIYIGAEPKSEWLPKSIMRDEKGFILTGADVFIDEKLPDNWKLKRPPGLLETSVPGIFAAGDIRSGSVKRVASAVGEGAMSITFVHQYLNQFK